MKLTEKDRLTLENKIVACLDTNPDEMINVVAEKCGITRQTASKYIGKLRGEERIKKVYERTYDDSMFKDTFEHDYTWSNGFLRNVRRYGNCNAVIDPETARSWTYKELNVEANKLAHGLQKIGLGKNDVVMVATRNCPEFAFCYTGPRKIGVILLCADASLASGEFALLMNHNNPKAVIYSANIRDNIIQASKKTDIKDITYIMADNLEGIELPAGHFSYQDFVSGMEEDEPVVNFRGHIYDEVLRLCTSGTTALPKSVPVNDINEVLSAHDVIMQYPLNKNDVTLNMTPWFHRGGCHCGGPGPVFYVGGAIVVMRNFRPKTVLKWVSEYNVSFMTGVPSNLDMLAKAQESEGYDISNLKGLVTMGAPFSKSECTRYCMLLTPNIFNGYGTTETFWNAFLRPYDLPEGAGSVGSSCIDDEVRVVKIYDDRKAEPDEMVEHDGITEGEIIIKSPAKSSYSYFHNTEMEKERYYKGWYYTGDTGKWNEDWCVTVCGRKDDMMIVAGENVYPTQIEDTIKELPKVKDCIVTSIPDKIRGQAIVAYVVPEDPTLTITELGYLCLKSPMLSIYKMPRYYALLDSIPRTATGKKQHFLMKNRAEKDLADGILKRP